MKILDCKQGDDTWLAIRAEHFCASDAPAMMGASKYTTRSELLHRLATGITQDVDAGKQSLFDRGHAAEAAARPIVEAQIGEELFPVVATMEVDGIPLLSSLDGISMDEDTAWEHKLWSEPLAAQVRAEKLDDQYIWQLEHALLVTGASRAVFTCSDGTSEKMVSMEYFPDLERRKQLIAGWRQFAADLKSYTPPEVIPVPVAAPQMSLPAVAVTLSGDIVVRDNLVAFGDALTAYVERINRKPESDQDFADLEATVKTLKAAEEALSAAESNAMAQVASVDDLKRAVAQYRDLARSNRLVVERLVKAEKENRRNAIIQGGVNALKAHADALNKRIGKPYIQTIAADFAGAAKGLKTITSLQNAVDTELARAKIEASETADRIQANLNTLKELATGLEYLFADAGNVIAKQNDDFTALVKTRIAEHAAKEAKRIEAEREKIRAEEEAKAKAKMEQETAKPVREQAVVAPTGSQPQAHVSVTRIPSQADNELNKGNAILRDFVRRFRNRKEFISVLVAIDAHLGVDA